MLIGVTNFAAVQFIQVLTILFFMFISAVIVNVRFHLPKTKWDGVIDSIMCIIILIIAITLKINLST
jgi:hypothetical protein